MFIKFLISHTVSEMGNLKKLSTLFPLKTKLENTRSVYS